MDNKAKLIFFFVFLVLGFSSFYLYDSSKANKDSVSFKQKNKDELKQRQPASRINSKLGVEKKLQKKIPSQPVVTYINQQRARRRKPSANSFKKKIKNKKDLVKIAGDNYYLLNDQFALIANEENKNRYPDHSEKLGHILVENFDYIPEDALAVTQNADNGALGIMTGIIEVTFKDFSSHRQLFGNRSFIITNIYEHIKLAHYKFDDSKVAIESFGEIQSNPNIVRSKLEILEYVRSQK